MASVIESADAQVATLARANSGGSEASDSSTFDASLEAFEELGVEEYNAKLRRVESRTNKALDAYFNTQEYSAIEGAGVSQESTSGKGDGQSAAEKLLQQKRDEKETAEIERYQHSLEFQEEALDEGGGVLSKQHSRPNGKKDNRHGVVKYGGGK